MGECPICAAEVELAADAMAGELLVCEDCGAELELKNLDPVELAEVTTDLGRLLGAPQSGADLDALAPVLAVAFGRILGLELVAG